LIENEEFANTGDMREGGTLPAGPDIYRGREAAAGRQSVILVRPPFSRAVAGWLYAAKTTHFSENIKIFKKDQKNLWIFKNRRIFATER